MCPFCWGTRVGCCEVTTILDKLVAWKCKLKFTKRCQDRGDVQACVLNTATNVQHHSAEPKLALRAYLLQVTSVLGYIAGEVSWGALVAILQQINRYRYKIWRTGHCFVLFLYIQLRRVIVSSLSTRVFLFHHYFNPAKIWASCVASERREKKCDKCCKMHSLEAASVNGCARSGPDGCLKYQMLRRKALDSRWKIRRVRQKQEMGQSACQGQASPTPRNINTQRVSEKRHVDGTKQGIVDARARSDWQTHETNSEVAKRAGFAN